MVFPGFEVKKGRPKMQKSGRSVKNAKSPLERPRAGFWLALS
jgi:hypothetical protein